MLQTLFEMIRKDLKLFASDRRAMIISFAVPIAIASFMAFITSSASQGKPATKIAVLVVDQDHSPVTADVVKALAKSESVEPKTTTLEAAEQSLRNGDAGLAVVLPSGFGSQSGPAMTGGPKPQLRFLSDPSKAAEAGVAKAAVTQAIMQTVARDTFGGNPSPPFEVKEVAQNAPKQGSEWSGESHAFAGMAVQGLLFWAIECAMGILRERKQGIWKRQRTAPVSANALLLGRLLSASVRALAIVIVVFGYGALAFHIRIGGSWLGFATVAVAASVMAAAFGMFVAALGKTEQQSRGLSILAVLTMTMLGGAWFPSFLMPKWVQTVSLAIPVRWAVDGFDFMTWRGGGLDVALRSAGILLAFAAVFAVFALRRFRYEAE